ncbi:N-acetylmuramoyl-L-alanine amidase [Dysgonomonadaceae bacterium PH5-43]|nr:N-acetylmuramoyl-L-alanine amidase [Dysgonomonadaceae bacterium PH5-43]
MKIKYILLFIVFVFSFGATAQEKATPLKGEGSINMLIRYGYTYEDLGEFVRINKGKFTKDKTLILGVEYKLPSKEKQVAERGKVVGKEYKEPLFGKGYETYTVESKVLEGACIYLVSGHGGPDPGAMIKAEGKFVHEAEYAYDIMLRLARNLLVQGATVHIIIQDSKDGIRDERILKRTADTETCMGKTIPKAQLERLIQRCETITELSKKTKETYQRAIFIHLDSRDDKLPLDVYFYHYGNKGKAFSETLCETLKASYNKQPHRRGNPFTGSVIYRNLHVLRNTNIVSTYAELANMQNVVNQKRYLEVNNRQALANWLRDGIIKDYNNNK